MKKGTRLLLGMLSVALCAVLIFSTAPVSKAAGMMRFIIDDQVYNKVYNDMGSLVLTHYHYSYSKDKLTLENFGTAESPETPLFIYPYSGNITIELKGDNYIKAEREMALIIIGNVTFTGDGTLNIIAADTYGIYTDYKVTVSESASLNINALAGITAIKGFDISTSGTVNIHTTGKCLYAYDNIKITQGILNFSGSNGIYTAYGDVFISGGQTELVIDSTSRAIYAAGQDAYIEWSANANIYAGNTAPGFLSTSYNNEKYLRVSFVGPPKLNPPREIYWDDTVIDSAGATNPVGRWSAVENATGYEVYLYYYNEVGYALTKTFTVTDALSCNFGGYFTSYGKYFFSVRALGDGVDYITSNSSARTTGYYFFTGEVESRYYVTLPESEYFTVIPETGSTIAYYGESYSFTVEVDPAYTQSEVLVWANGVRIPLRKGKYTVDRVTENIVIKIGDMSINTYTVNLPEHEAYTIYPLPDYSTEVEYGGSFAFSVELSDIYLNSDIVVTSNGETITPKYGIIYTVKNITEDQTIEITGLIRDNYEVRYQHLDGTFITSQTVEHGAEAYEPSVPELAEGLEFVGWSLKDGTAYDFSTPVERQLTLYARFEPAKEDGYYLLSTFEQFVWFRNEVNFGNTAINAKLCTDIAMNNGKHDGSAFDEDAVVWKPIGGYDYSDNENFVKFYEGKFDGGGHVLSGFYIEYDKMSSESSDLGIFGGISETAVVSNLKVVDSCFEAYGNIGGIVGTSFGKIENCTSSVCVTGVEDVGGIVGENHGNVTNCIFDGVVTAEQYSSSSSLDSVGGNNAGGIAGNCANSNSVVVDCVSKGSIAAKKNAGGIVGAATADGVAVSNCINSSTVYADKNSAGILAYNPKQIVQEIKDASGEVIETITETIVSTVSDCYNNGNISSADSSGGIVSSARVVITNCKNNGRISSLAGAGGIASESIALIDSCENTAAVEGALSSGGIASDGDVTVKKSVNKAETVSSQGSAAGIASGGKAIVEYCYNIGKITGNTYAGGIACSTDSATIKSSHNYAEVAASQADGICAGATNITVERSYSAAERSSTLVGTQASEELFYCGYVAIQLNGSDEAPVWAQGAEYPVFADKENIAYVFPFSGDGTQSSPYIIMTEDELRTISAYINNHSGWSSKHYKLGADIEISNNNVANNLIPFGSISNVFSGSFDGDGHTISGVNISAEDSNVALFRVVAANAQVSNLHLENFAVTGNKNVGALVGTNRGNINNCSVNGSTIVGVENVGGVIGYNLGQVSYVTNDSEVKGELCIGGIVGQHESGNILSCGNFGEISGVQDMISSEAGGITGRSYSDVYYCFNMGNIKADEYAGGIIGLCYAEFRSLYNHGKVSAADYYDSIVGYTDEQEPKELCFSLEGTSSGQTGIGTDIPEVDFFSGMLAYALNNNGTEKNWAQADGYPVPAQPDGSDAVIYTVTYYSCEEVYYMAATKKNGAAVTPPVPECEGHIFRHWDNPFDNVVSDMKTTAVFYKPYSISFTPYSELDYFESEMCSVICGIRPENGMTVAQLRNWVANENILIMDKDMTEVCDPNQKVSTGMTVILYGANEWTYLHIADVVIFGDISGDGEVNDIDAFLLNLVLSEMIYIDELYPSEQLAADVNRDGVIDRADAVYLQKYLLYDNDISQSSKTDNK